MTMFKRILSLFLSLVMVVSMLPVQSLAQEITPEPTEAAPVADVLPTDPAPTEAPVLPSEPQIVAAQSVTLSAGGDTASVTAGQTLQLTAVVAPQETTDKTLLWTSSDETVATVDQTGLVTGLAPGGVTISAACGEVQGSYALTVNAAQEEVPTEPEAPSEPSEPEDPTEPSVPEDPTEPSVPEDPTEPSEPQEPDNRCGDNVTWELTDYGLLILSGTGDMWDYALNAEGTAADTPWADSAAAITTVTVNEGVTGLGSYAFFGCSQLSEVNLCADITRIADTAFTGCGEPDICFEGTCAQWEALDCGLDAFCADSEPLFPQEELVPTRVITPVEKDGQIIYTYTEQMLPAASPYASKGKLSKPSNLQWGYINQPTWNNGKPTDKLVARKGGIVWKHGTNSDSATVTLYRGSTQVSSYNWRFGSDPSAYRTVSSFLIDDHPSGTYQFSVQDKDSTGQYSNSDTVKSGTFSYLIPGKKIKACTNPVWNWPTATWKLPGDTSHFGGYQVEWYYAKKQNETPECYGGSWTLYKDMTSGLDIFDEMLEHGAGYYYFKIRALSDDITVIQNSDWSGLSAPYYWNGTDEPADPAANAYLFTIKKNVRDWPMAYNMALYSMLAYGETKPSGSAWVYGENAAALGDKLHNDGYNNIWSVYYPTAGSQYVTPFQQNSAGVHTSPYTMAHRKVKDENNNVTDEILLVFRGTYEMEWFGNFDVTGPKYDSSKHYHDSFQQAVDATMLQAGGYIEGLIEDGVVNNENIKIVLTGHSRGGAVANMMAHELTDISNGITSGKNYSHFAGIKVKDVYAYTFATPNVASYNTIKAANGGKTYDNIFNYCFTDDFVPNLPLEKWSWGKYGKTYWLTAANLGEDFHISLDLHWGKDKNFDIKHTKSIVQSMNTAVSTIDNYYNKSFRYDKDEYYTMHKFIRTALGGTMGGNAVHSATGAALLLGTAKTEYVVVTVPGMSTPMIVPMNFCSGELKNLAANLIDGGVVGIKPLNDAHESQTYWLAIRDYHSSFVYSELTASGYDKTTYSTNTVAVDPASCDSAQVAAFREFLNTSISVLKDNSEEVDFTMYNYELLGWDPEDVTTWTGITWQDGSIIGMDMRYSGVVGSLDLSDYPDLVLLDVSYCNISQIKAQGCPNLSDLYCSGNWITSLDVSGLDQLANLQCSHNQLEELDLTGCTALEYLECDSNLLTQLDLSDCDALWHLRCTSNYLDPSDPQLRAVAERILADEGVASYEDQMIPTDAEFCETDLERLLAIAETDNNQELLRWDPESPASWTQASWIPKDGIYYLEELDLSGLGLTGHAVFDGCEELTYLNIQDNGFQTLSVADCPNLSALYCERNYLYEEDLRMLVEELGITTFGISPQRSDKLLNSADVAALDRLSAAHSLGWNPDLYASYRALHWEHQDDGTYKLVGLDFSETPVLGLLDLTGFRNLTWVSCQRRAVTQVLLPASITEIDNYTFLGCDKLTTIRFSGNAPTFSDMCFLGLDATVYYPSGNSSWKNVIGQHNGGSITWSASVASGFIGQQIYWTLDETNTLTIAGTGELRCEDGEFPFARYSGRVEKIVIGSGITGIYDSAFRGFEKLTVVTLPDSLKVIGDWVFADCRNLSQLVLPAGLTEIGTGALRNIWYLKTLAIPASVNKLGEAAFYGSSLTEVFFWGSAPAVPEDGQSVFGYCTANVYYSTANNGWTEEYRDALGSSLKWTLFNAQASTVGQCGPSLYYRVNEADGTLTISGTGAMTAWDGVTTLPPWLGYKASLHTLIVRPGVTSLSDLHMYFSTIRFEGDAPALDDAILAQQTTAYYPAGSESWANVIRDNAIRDFAGSAIKWIPSGTAAETIHDLVQNKDSLYPYQILDALHQLDEQELLSLMEQGLIMDDLDQLDLFLSGNTSYMVLPTISRDVPGLYRTYIPGWSIQNLYLNHNSSIPGQMPNVYIEPAQQSMTLPEGITASETIPFHIQVDAFGQHGEYRNELEVPLVISFQPEEGDNPFFYSMYRWDEETSALVPVADEAFWIKTGMQYQFLVPASGDYLLVKQADSVLSGTCGQNVQWCYDGSTLTLTGSGPMANYGFNQNHAPWYNFYQMIDAIVIGDGITTIGSYAFNGLMWVNSLVIPASVTTIGEGAFFNTHEMYLRFLGSAPSLHENALLNFGTRAYYRADAPGWDTAVQNIYGANTNSFCWIPITFNGSCGENLTWAFEEATGTLTISGTGEMTNFYSWSTNTPWGGYADRITTIVVQEGVTSLGANAFSDCTNVTSMTLPDSLELISDGSLPTGALTELTIPRKITYLDIFATALPSIERLHVDPENNTYTAVDGVLYSKDMTTLYMVPRTLDGSFVVPYGVTRIESFAFSDCKNLTEVYLPETLTEIGMYAFGGCTGLSDLYIPDQVALIDIAAFCDCINLQSVTIGRGLQQLEDAFQGCNSLQFITFTGAAPAHMKSYFYGYDGRLTIFYCVDEPGWTKALMESLGTGINWVANTDIYIEPLAMTSQVVSGQKLQLAAYSMENGDNVKVTWRVRDEDKSFASVDTSGNVTARNVDKFTPITVYAKPAQGGSAAFTLLIVPKATSVTIRDLEKDTVLGQTGTTTQKLSLDLYDTNYMILNAVTAEEDAMDNIRWTSSKEDVATVSEYGYVEILAPGSTTITATADDGSGTKAAVQLDVYYIDTASRLTVKTEVPFTGLPQGKTTALNVYGTDKEKPIDPIFLTYSIPEDQQHLASVDADGIVTAIAPGTVSVTAAIANDPLGRSIKTSVKVGPAQTEKILLTPVDAAAPANIYMLDAQGQITDDPEAVVNYAVYLDKDDVVGGEYIFQIAPTAVDTLGNTMELTRSSLKWQSTDTRVATGTANSDGTSIVKVKAKTDGACAIYATSSDDAKVESQLYIYVRDYAPRMDTNSLTLNTQMFQGVSTALVESYDCAVTAISLHEYDSAAKDYMDAPSDRFFPQWENGVLTISTQEVLANATVKTRLMVQCSNGETYTYDLSLRISNSIPTVTTAQPTRFNLHLGTLAEVKVTARNAVVTDVTIPESLTDSFRRESFDPVTGTLSLCLAEDYRNGAALDAKLDLEIWLDGYRSPVTKTVTVGTTTERPTITVKQAQKADLFYRDSQFDLAVTAKNLTVTHVMLDPSSTDSFEDVLFDAASGQLKLRFSEKLRSDGAARADTSVTLKIWLAEYNTPVTQTFNIATVTNKPKLKLSLASSVINTAISADPSTFFTVQDAATGEDIFLRPGEAVSTAAFARAQADGGDINLSSPDALVTADFADVLVNGGIRLTLTTPQNGKRNTGGTAYIDVQLPNWRQSIRLTHRVSVQTKLPTVTLGTGTLKLNRIFTWQQAATTAVLNQNNLRIGKMEFASTATRAADLTESQKIHLSYSDGIITASILDPDNVPANGTYSFRYTTWLDDGVTELAAGTLRINIHATVPGVQLKTANLRLNSALAVFGTEASSLVALTNGTGYTFHGFLELNDETVQSWEEDFALRYDEQTAALTAAFVHKNVPNGNYSIPLTPLVQDNASGQIAAMAKQVTLRINVSRTLPTASLPMTAVKLNTLFPSLAEQVSLTLNQGLEPFVIDRVIITPAAKEGTDAYTQSQKLKISYQYNGKLTVRLANFDDLPKNGTYSYDCTVILADGTALAPKTLRVSVGATAPTVRMKAISLDLNRQLGLQAEASSVMTLTGAPGFTLTNLTPVKYSEDFSFRFHEETQTLQVSLENAGAAKGRQTVEMYPTYRHTSGYELQLMAPVKITVNVTDTKPGITVSSKGSLDTMDPNSAITYTVSRISNIPAGPDGSWDIESVTLGGADRDYFEISEVIPGAKPSVELRQVENLILSTAKSYKVDLIFRVRGVDIVYSTTVRLKQSSLKFNAIPTQRLYQFQRSPITVTVDLASPATAKLGEITVNSKSDTAILRALGATDAAVKVELSEDKRTATVSFNMQYPGYLVYGRSYRLILDVKPENCASNVKPTQITVNVKSYK